MPDEYQKKLIEYARKMRKYPTRAELVVWSWLKNKQINGLRFRRQYIFHSFILDFYCPSKNLAIEIDGSTHDIEGIFNKDIEKEKFLKEKGLRLIRLSDEDILMRKVDISLLLTNY